MIERVLQAMQGVHKSGAQWKALCPSHADQQASLAIRVVDGGKVLLRCHADCATEDILAAAGLSMQDLFADALPPREDVPQFGGVERVKPKQVAAYPYRGADGALLYESVRYEPKTFRQRRPDGAGGWLWNLEGVARVPYRLPELLAAPVSTAVWVVEGEKNANALVTLGLVATCNVGGAGKWKDEYSEHLRGRMVVVLPDNDEPGRTHADAVARSLVGVAKALKVVALPGLPPKGDVVDWITEGGTKEQLVALAKATPPFVPLAEPPPPRERATHDLSLEDLLVGWMLTASPTERSRWFGRVIPDLVADADKRLVVAAILETHGVTAEVDPSRCWRRCGRSVRRWRARTRRCSRT